MNEAENLVAFSLENRRFALRLSAVERVVRAVEVTPLPKAPESVWGVINVHGHIVPVVDIRARFHLPGKALELTDYFIIAATIKRTVALVVDLVSGVIGQPQPAIIPAEEILPGMRYVEGATKIEGDIVLIHDLERFLSLEEERALDEALGEGER